MSTPTRSAPPEVVAWPTLLVLASLAALSPVATDLYLPGFPDLGDDLGVGASAVQLTLTGSLVGLALGQLVMGPLSDRYGRRVPLVASCAVAVAAAVCCSLAPTLGVLLAARVVQGFAGSGGMVIGRAVIADLVTGRAAARAFTLMLTVGGIAPVLAPLVGGLLHAVVGWRGLLWVMTGLTAAALLGVVLALPESHPPAGRATGGASHRCALRTVVTTRGYWPPVAVLGCSFAMLMAYISASPFVYQDVVGLSAVEYGLCFGVNAVGLVSAGWVTGRLVDGVDPARIVRTAMGVQLGSTLTFLALAVAGAPAWLLPVPVFAAVTTLGAVMGNASARAMSQVRPVAGMGSAVLGFTQFTMGAAVSPLVGLGGTESAVVPALVMSAASATGWALSRGRPRGRPPRRAAGAAATRSRGPSRDVGASAPPR